MIEIFGFLAGFTLFAIIFTFVVPIALYFIQGVLLNKFNKAVTGENAWQAWVPFAQFYLLGKLTFDKTVGWILLVLSVVTGNLFIFDVFERKGDPTPLVSIFNIVCIGLVIYSFVKYSKLKNNKAIDDKSGTKTCPKCGAVQNNKSNFCTNCGEKM